MRGRYIHIKMIVATLIVSIASVLSLTGCDDHRDLYVTATPLVVVEGDWVPSLGLTDMNMNATAVGYDESGIKAISYFGRGNTTALELNRGTYNIMIFNGLMYSPEETHLDDVYFRNIDQLETFEAGAVEGPPSKRLSRAEDEYIASNNMELFTSATYEQVISGDDSYFLKYVNGENGYDTPATYVEAELSMTPIVMNYNCHIIVTLNHISSAWSASAALKGFVGSAFVHNRKPSNFYVTHHVLMNNKQMTRGSNEDRGTIESSVFVTFGPPVDAPDNRYSVYLSITLSDGQVWAETIDVTDQVLPIIEKIKKNLTSTAHNQIPIVINLNLGEYDLPDVGPNDGSIGVGDWEDDEIIQVPIPKPKT